MPLDSHADSAAQGDKPRGAGGASWGAGHLAASALRGLAGGVFAGLSSAEKIGDWVSAFFSDHSKPFSDLFMAAQLGDLSVVQKLATRRTCARRNGPLGQTALMTAATHRHVQCVKALLPFSDASVGDADSQSTALMLAAHAGNFECVLALIGASDVAQQTPENWGSHNALMFAAAAGNHRCVEALLSPEAQRQTNHFKRTALMMAADKPSSNLASVELLIPESDLAATDSNGSTALALAAQRGHADRVAALIAADQTPEHEVAQRLNTEGRTPLMAAAVFGHVECVKLLAPVSMINAQDKDGDTALTLLMKHAPDSPQAFEALRFLGPIANLSIVNRNGEDAISAGISTLRPHASFSDWLASQAPLKIARIAVEKHGREILPQAAAFVDAAVLRDELAMITGLDTARNAEKMAVGAETVAASAKTRAPRRKPRAL